MRQLPSPACRFCKRDRGETCNDVTPACRNRKGRREMALVVQNQKADAYDSEGVDADERPKRY